MTNGNKPNFSATKETKDDPKPKREEIAVVWKKVDKNGKDYLSIKVKIEGKDYNITAFANSYKQVGDPRPDFIAWKDKE